MYIPENTDIPDDNEDVDDAEIDRVMEAMLYPWRWPALMTRHGTINVLDLLPVNGLGDQPAHRLILLMVLQLAVKDGVTAVHFEPWDFHKDPGEHEEDEGDDRVGVRMFYEVRGELFELVPPPRWFRPYIARDIETLASLNRMRGRIAQVLRYLANKIDGQQPELRRGHFTLKVGETLLEVEVRVYHSELGGRYFLHLPPISEAVSEEVWLATHPHLRILNDRPDRDHSVEEAQDSQ